MPEPTTPHPSARQLADFRKGSLAAEDFAHVAMHIASCPECREKVEKPAETYRDKLRALRAARKEGSSLSAPGPDTKSGPETTASPQSPAEPTPAPAPPLAAEPMAAPVPPASEVPPELLASGKYEVLGKVGQGGMGSVWKAKHAFLNRVVAVKVLRPDALEHIESRDRFLKEMHAVGTLEHKNIVRAHDAERVGEVLLLVMEFVEGISLQKLVKQKGPLPIRFSCRIIAQAADALQHAHEKHMVHRDIKPQNLMVTKADKEVKILDFGLARLPRGQVAIGGETRAQTFLGTPEYVAPEQANDARSADIRADIYSLGCTLYYLLAGKPPFEGAIPLATIVAHLQEPPVPLPELRPNVSEKLWAVVAKMLAKKPEDRYQTPRELADALQPFTEKRRGNEEDTSFFLAEATGSKARQPADVGGETPMPSPSRVLTPPPPSGGGDWAHAPSAYELFDPFHPNATPSPWWRLSRWFRDYGVVLVGLLVVLLLLLLLVVLIWPLATAPVEKSPQPKSGPPPQINPLKKAESGERGQRNAAPGVKGGNTKANQVGPERLIAD